MADIEVQPAVHHDISAPLRSIPPQAAIASAPHDHPLRLLHPPYAVDPHAPDGALQTSVTPNVSVTGGTGFAGVGNGDYGFTPNAAPPDTNGAVGATQYVQWVNESFAVFDKTTGALLLGPVAGNTLWSGFGGPCETNNDGDPIAIYDKAANRWVMSQFSVTGGPPFYQCVAVSTTSDATGSYARYAFQQPNFNDYPKFGVWPDAYYATFNMFSGNSFAGGRVCAFDRTSMLAGAAATQQCVQLSSSFGGLLPSDLDGTTAPPAGAPNTVLNFGTSSLNFWEFHVDWTTPANSSLTGPHNLPVATFTEACGGGTCVPQPSTRQQLDSLGDRLMYRLAYRHFTDGHEALVVNHSVAIGSTKKRGSGTVGVRWYELRGGANAWSVFQQGTFSPDSNFRWMGSIAQDKAGNIAVGYSVSSGTVFPSLRFTGRVPTDPLGTMESETSILGGSGAQLTNLNRWGDYSAMTVDPVDDCTMWYTNEYLKASGTFNWSTFIFHFKFPSCQ